MCVERDTSDEPESPRERGHVLHVVCGGGRAVADTALARRRQSARHHQVPHEDDEHQARRARRAVHSDRVARGAQGSRVLPRQRPHTPRHQGGQHTARPRRLHSDSRLRRERLHLHRWRHDARQGQAHVRGHAVLDGARGDGAEAERLRHQGRHLVAGHHSDRVGHRHGALSQVSAHEGAHDDAAESAAHARHVRRGEGPVQELQQDVSQDDRRMLAQGSERAADGQAAAQARLLQEGQGQGLHSAQSGAARRRAQHESEDAPARAVHSHVGPLEQASRRRVGLRSRRHTACHTVAGRGKN